MPPPPLPDLPEPRKLRIGVSACLLGQEVRYNGGHKRDSFLMDVLGPYVEWVPVCPEVEIGLGTPRPPIRLERDAGAGGVGGILRLVMPDSGEDLTERMRGFSERRVRELEKLDLSGYVLKKDSPSCGMERVKVYNGGFPGGSPGRDGRGLFAESLLRLLPDLPVEEEGRLNDPLLRESFITRVFVHDRWLEGERQGWTRAALMGFHEQHKLLLMARNQNGMRRLGRLLGEPGRTSDPAELAREYRRGLTEVLKRPPTRRGHTNVLHHLLGYVSGALDRDAGDERAEVVETIERYRLGLLPLVVPLTLIRHHVRRQRVEYLQGQAYLEPHPHEMMLLNHV